MITPAVGETPNTRSAAQQCGRRANRAARPGPNRRPSLPRGPFLALRDFPNGRGIVSFQKRSVHSCSRSLPRDAIFRWQCVRASARFRFAKKARRGAMGQRCDGLYSAMKFEGAFHYRNAAITRTIFAAIGPYSDEFSLLDRVPVSRDRIGAIVEFGTRPFRALLGGT